MSRQFRFFLLPSDVERLVGELRSRHDFVLIRDHSACAAPIPVDFPPREPAACWPNGYWYGKCCLHPSVGADVRMQYIAGQGKWFVAEEFSEVIEFSGCHFDGSKLRIGRFYFQTDMLIGDTIWPKKKEFLNWADKIFKTAKRLLQWSKKLEAYLGQDAAKWIEEGGQIGQF